MEVPSPTGLGSCRSSNTVILSDGISLGEKNSTLPSVEGDAVVSRCSAHGFPSPSAAKHNIRNIVATALEFEADHHECERVLTYTDNDRTKVHLYMQCGTSGIPQELKDTARKSFTDMDVDLEWFDLHKDANEIRKGKSLEYPLGTPLRLNDSQIDQMNKTIKENLHLLAGHRNITAVQPSLKITNSKQTKTPCITLYVLRKGHIPDGECAFPPIFASYPVDVVDGLWLRTGDPWTPNEAQEQSEVLCLGASIGVKEEYAAGTLGAIVKGNETFYALSCNHVMKHSEKSEIVHPAWNDHRNYLNYHLQQYGERVKDILDPISLCAPNKAFEFSLYTDLDEMSAKFEELKQIKQRNLKSSRATERKLSYVDFHENAFRKGHTSPRVIGRYTAGVSGNVTWTDGQQYYIDAAVAELKPDEVISLHESQTAEMIGTGYCPGDVVQTGGAATGPLCKSGRTTGFTDSGCHSKSSLFTNSESYKVTDETRQLANVLKTEVNICTQCADLSGLRHLFSEEDIINYSCGFCELDLEGLKDHLWCKNCLCIDNQYSVRSRPGFTTKGDSGAVLFERFEDETLCGFGIIFGELQHSYGIYSLASPLHIVLETLTKMISQEENFNLTLVSNYTSDV
ncbi:hypothetical protein AWC38_SpisGene16300 [Stylophora pistillata]|uniref:Uncharacterized protein n=1 Tax=Stylophora pistillata TaxID=50429 RepID=A0A2B4RNX5_STYPI|nr:hypothetical protein AWC38_SpisGene16300 [Stylophora pistillata]